MFRTLRLRTVFLLLLWGRTLGAVLAFFASYVGPRRGVLDVWRRGGVGEGGALAVFVHFDRRGDLAPHTRRYLASFRDAGYRIAFVTNAGCLTQDARAAVQEICDLVIVRRNLGYDFGAVRDTLEILSKDGYKPNVLLIANDSVYGLSDAVRRIMERVDFGRADVFGATESWQHNYHLQSYLLVLGRRALDDPSWAEFWKRVRQVNSKTFVVRVYEVGLTRALMRAGLRCEALWPYQTLLRAAAESDLHHPAEDEHDPLTRMRLLAAERIRIAIATRTALNPTAELWRQLLEAGFPYLKVELVKRNPGKVADIADWRVVLGRPYEEDGQMIEDDLKGCLRGSGP